MSEHAPSTDDSPVDPSGSAATERGDGPAYLSPEWFAAAADLVASADALAAPTAGVHLVVQQSVTTDDGAIVWHVAFDDGTVRLVEGQAEAAGRTPDITFSCDLATALDVHRGAIGAQSAFIDGRLRIGGDIAALLAHGEMFAALDDVLAPLR